jgi:amidase
VDLDAFADLDATALADLVARKEVTPRELAECALRGVERINPTLNAVVEGFAERVDAMDDSIPEGPFAGVPTMLKDLFHGEQGTACGNGSRLSAGWVAPTHGQFTARLRAAGLVNVGRTTTSEFGIMGTTETLAAGRTCSPWSASHMAGGSSGGAAAVVGAGIVPVASASDGGGSIRIPASACGVVGLKPSRGRITWGPQIAEALVGWAVHFVVARSVRDTAGLLDCLAGPEPGDPFVIAPPARPFAAEVGADAGRLRVAWCSDPWSGDAADPQVVEATQATAQLLEDLGHHVEVARPEFAWEPFLQAMVDVWSADNAHTIDGFARFIEREVSTDTLEASTLAAVEYGRTVSAGQLLDALGQANLLARLMGGFFQRYDVLLTPTLGRLPLPLGVYDPTASVDLREIFTSWGALESFCPVFNATGQPALSLPLHHSREGLPIGMQLVAASGGESTLLRVAAQLEQAAPWAARRPPIHVAAPADQGLPG